MIDLVSAGGKGYPIVNRDGVQYVQVANNILVQENLFSVMKASDSIPGCDTLVLRDGTTVDFTASDIDIFNMSESSPKDMKITQSDDGTINFENFKSMSAIVTGTPKDDKYSFTDSQGVAINGREGADTITFKNSTIVTTILRDKGDNATFTNSPFSSFLNPFNNQVQNADGNYLVGDDKKILH